MVLVRFHLYDIALIVQVIDSRDFLHSRGLLNRSRLRLRYGSVSVRWLQELSHASRTDTSEALDSDVLDSLRRVAVDRLPDSLGEPRVLCLCSRRVYCRTDHNSGCSNWSPSVVLSVSAVPTRKMLQVWPRLCLEAWHTLWIRNKRNLFI